MSAKRKPEQVVISPINTEFLQIRVEGTAPLVTHHFSGKAIAQMRAKMLAGSRSRKGTAREPRDFQADYEGAMHVAEEGWLGMPASAFRQAMISACRLVGFKMTIAKLSLFVEANGISVDGKPLVKIQGEPQPHEGYARNETGVADIRVRPMWRQWHIDLLIKYDADQFSAQDVYNLLERAGCQVGVGEGRPDSRASSGLGWGTFKLCRESKISGLDPDLQEAA